MIRRLVVASAVAAALATPAVVVHQVHATDTTTTTTSTTTAPASGSAEQEREGEVEPAATPRTPAATTTVEPGEQPGG